MNLYVAYCENIHVNQPLKVTRSAVAVAGRTVKSDGAKLYNLVLNSAIKLF